MAEQYPQSDLLTEPSWLLEHLNDPDLRIIDVRGAGQYGGGHIFGAVNLPVARLDDPSAPIPGTLVGPERFAMLAGNLGISQDHHIVLCDQADYRMAARAFWAFDYYGHVRLSVLSGGLAQWVAGGGEMIQTMPQVQAVQYAAEPHPDRLATKADVLERLENPTVALLDVRSPAEYSGQMVQAMRGGHIPGAVNVEFVDALAVSDVVRIRPAVELQRLYEQAGVTPDKEVITYCQSGMRSAHSYFVLRLLGYDRLRNYAGSWGEWGNDLSLPVET